MKWYIDHCITKEGKKIKNTNLKDAVKYAVNYYRRLLEGTLGKITWLTLCDKTALIIARKENAFEVGKDNYSLIAGNDWDWVYYDTDDVKIIIMEKDKISIATRRAKDVRGDKKNVPEKKRSSRRK